MRIRSAWLTPAVPIAGITLASPHGSALAATSVPTKAHTVVLPTGDLVQLSGVPGQEHVVLQSAATTGIASAHRSGLKDVTGGSNGFCGHDYLCTGVKGYDGPTGLGSPRGLKSL